MRLTSWIKLTGLLAVPCVLLGGVFKIMHWAGADLLLLLGLLSGLGFVVGLILNISEPRR